MGSLVPPYPGSGWSGSEGPGRKIWGGGSAPPPSSCANIVLAMQSYDSGYIDCGAPGCTTPTTFNVNTVPSAYPDVVVTNVFMLNTFEGSSGAPVTVAAPWTRIQSGDGPTHSLSISAYHAIGSGTGGNEQVGWSGGGRYFAQGALGIVIPTSHGTPVQSVEDAANSATITLPSPPTAGNLLVLTRSVVAAGGGFGTGGPPADFPAQIAVLGIWDGGVSHMWGDIDVRCVQIGDGQTYNIAPPGSPQHTYVTLSEWAL